MPTENRSSNTEVVGGPRKHELKIHTVPLNELLSGAKTGEIRDCYDRDFAVGDTVLLREVAEDRSYTGRTARRTITHVQKHYGLPDHLCVLSYGKPAEQHQGEPSEYPPCDYCGIVPDHHPWHGSGLLSGVENRHIHACDACRGRLPLHPGQRQGADTLTFKLMHPFTKERRAVTLTKAEVADGMEDTLYEKLVAQFCQCEPVGETNVVDCNCDEYCHDFDLIADSASAQAESSAWQPLTAPGQIQLGDWLSFTVAGKFICAQAREILSPGTSAEEVIYNRRQNHYFVTSMAIDGTSTHKGVLVAKANSKS